MSTLTGIYFRSKGFYIGVCLEVQGAWTQGRTLRECKRNLAEASALLIGCEAEKITGYASSRLHVECFALNEKKIIAEYFAQKGVHYSSRRQETYHHISSTPPRHKRKARVYYTS